MRVAIIISELILMSESYGAFLWCLYLNQYYASINVLLFFVCRQVGDAPSTAPIVGPWRKVVLFLFKFSGLIMLWKRMLYID